MSLEVVVFKAVNLPNVERFGKIDPYVSISFKGNCAQNIRYLKVEIPKLKYDLRSEALYDNRSGMQLIGMNLCYRGALCGYLFVRAIVHGHLGPVFGSKKEE